MPTARRGSRARSRKRCRRGRAGRRWQASQPRRERVAERVDGRRVRRVGRRVQRVAEDPSVAVAEPAIAELGVEPREPSLSLQGVHRVAVAMAHHPPEQRREREPRGRRRSGARLLDAGERLVEPRAATPTNAADDESGEHEHERDVRDEQQRRRAFRRRRLADVAQQRERIGRPVRAFGRLAQESNPRARSARGTSSRPSRVERSGTAARAKRRSSVSWRAASARSSERRSRCPRRIVVVPSAVR